MTNVVRSDLRRNPAQDAEDAYVAEFVKWLRSGPDLSTLSFAKRGGSIKVTTQVTTNGEALQTLRAFNSR